MYVQYIYDRLCLYFPIAYFRLRQGTTWLPDDDLMIEIFWSDFKCINVKFYVGASVGIIKVILQSARCNNIDHNESFFSFLYRARK